MSVEIYFAKGLHFPGFTGLVQTLKWIMMDHNERQKESQTGKQLETEVMEGHQSSEC